MQQRPFFPGSTPGSPMWQPGAAQRTAWQQAVELIAQQIGETPPIDPAADKEQAVRDFGAWFNGLPAERRAEVRSKLGWLIVAELAAVHYFMKIGAAGAAAVVLALALAAFDYFTATEDD